MNDNEKMSLSEETTSTQPSACEVNPIESNSEVSDACAQEESPALEIAEAADEKTTDDTCIEETSPSMDLAMAADSVADEPKPADYQGLSKEELVGKMKEILDADKMQAHKEANLMKQAFFNIRKHETEEEMRAFVAAGNDIESFSATPDPQEEVFQELLSQFKERRAAYLQKEEDRRQENLALKLKAIEGIKTLMEDVDNINRNYTQFQKLQQDFKDVKDIPQQAETEIWKQYQTVVEQFYDLLKLNKELRDLDFKKNLEAKRMLIEEAKKLEASEDPIEASRNLQELHKNWREIGPVAKDIREEIWEEFKNISTVINKRHQEYFEQRKAREQANEEAKTKLCEEVESLKFDNIENFADWDKLTENIKELQARWKELGFASRKANNALFARFRKTIDDFFAAKTEFYKKVREEFKANLDKKTALCVKAEELAESENLNDATEEVKKLQEEWKTIGSVERKQSDIVWKRFKKACNSVFERRRKVHESKKEEENANLDAKRDVIARLTAIFEETEETGDSIKRMRVLQDEWRNIGFVPFSKKESIGQAYKEILDKLYEKLNLGAHRQQARRTSLREHLAASADPRTAISDRIRARKADLQTYENNLGFFNVKSSAGNSMVRELERKIDNIKKEIAELELQLKEQAKSEEA